MQSSNTFRCSLHFELWFVPNTVEDFFEDSSQHHEIFQFYPSFKLGKSISSTYSDREFPFKCEHFFFLKNSNLIVNWVPSLFYKSLGLQNSQIPNSLLNWEKSGNEAWAYIQKTYFYIFFFNLEKLRSSARATFKNPEIFFLIGRSLKV